jgi:nicotinamidase-related amidase
MKNPMLRQLTPRESVLVLLDHQAEPLLAMQSHERESIINHVIGLVEVAKVFKLPILLSTLEGENSGGTLFQELQAVLSDIKPIDRTCINALDDSTIKSTLKKFGRNKLIIAGLSTETSVTLTALGALRAEYEVFVVTDACGGANREVYERAVARMVNAGVVPTTWQQVTYELQSDWGNRETAEPIRSIVRNHFGSFALGTLMPHATGAQQRKGASKQTRVS